MGARESAEIRTAIDLVAQGSTPYAAAKAVKVSHSALYAALVRRGLHVVEPMPKKSPRKVVK